MGWASTGLHSIFVVSEAKKLYFNHQLFSMVYLVSANFTYFISRTGWRGSDRIGSDRIGSARSKTFVAVLLRDGLEYPNEILPAG